MRSSNLVFGVSVALFVASIALVIGRGPASDEPPPPPFRTEADVPDLMRTVLEPAADSLWAAVGTVVTPSGIEEWAPDTEEEWLAVEHGAAVLVESSNLLLIGNRKEDNENWVTFAQELADAATVALRAAESKDSEAVFNSGETVYLVCERCHMQYWQ
jgi:hypothetical protein